MERTNAKRKIEGCHFFFSLLHVLSTLAFKSSVSYNPSYLLLVLDGTEQAQRAYAKLWEWSCSYPLTLIFWSKWNLQGHEFIINLIERDSHYLPHGLIRSTWVWSDWLRFCLLHAFYNWRMLSCWRDSCINYIYKTKSIINWHNIILQ